MIKINQRLAFGLSRLRYLLGARTKARFFLGAVAAAPLVVLGVVGLPLDGGTSGGIKSLWADDTTVTRTDYTTVTRTDYTTVTRTDYTTVTRTDYTTVTRTDYTTVTRTTTVTNYRNYRPAPAPAPATPNNAAPASSAGPSMAMDASTMPVSCDPVDVVRGVTSDGAAVRVCGMQRP